MLGGADEVDKIMQIVDAKWNGVDTMFSSAIPAGEGNWKDGLSRHKEVKYGLE